MNSLLYYNKSFAVMGGRNGDGYLRNESNIGDNKKIFKKYPIKFSNNHRFISPVGPKQLEEFDENKHLWQNNERKLRRPLNDQLDMLNLDLLKNDDFIQ